MLTEQEEIALALTAELYKALLALPADHPHDMAENVRDIHNIQNRILARPAYRSQNLAKPS